jgi:hypothetical protein
MHVKNMLKGDVWKMMNSEVDSTDYILKPRIFSLVVSIVRRLELVSGTFLIGKRKYDISRLIVIKYNCLKAGEIKEN